MSIRYVIDEFRRVVVSTATGIFTDEDMRVHARKLAADATFDPEFRHLVDFRGVDRLEVSSDGVRENAAGNPWTKSTRRAVVCGSDEVYGMARMFQLLTEGDSPEVRVFREMSEARVWLELDPIE
jgi:hypothetical protein